MYIHTVLSNNRTDRIAQTITHRHFTSPFTSAMLFSILMELRPDCQRKEGQVQRVVEQ